MAEPDEVVQAIMPAGSTVYWAGGTYHGAGENRSADVWRESVFVSYALGWLKTVRRAPLRVHPPGVGLTPERLRAGGESAHRRAAGPSGDLGPSAAGDPSSLAYCPTSLRKSQRGRRVLQEFQGRAERQALKNKERAVTV